MMPICQVQWRERDQAAARAAGVFYDALLGRAPDLRREPLDGARALKIFRQRLQREDFLSPRGYPWWSDR